MWTEKALHFCLNVYIQHDTTFILCHEWLQHSLLCGFVFSDTSVYSGAYQCTSQAQKKLQCSSPQVTGYATVCCWCSCGGDSFIFGWGAVQDLDEVDDWVWKIFQATKIPQVATHSASEKEVGGLVYLCLSLSVESACRHCQQIRQLSL